MDRKKDEKPEEESNLGKPVIDINTGHVSIGLGSGITIDPIDGSIGISIAPGFGIEF